LRAIKITEDKNSIVVAAVVGVVIIGDDIEYIASLQHQSAVAKRKRSRFRIDTLI
jgi:hypothetical protein